MFKSTSYGSLLPKKSDTWFTPKFGIRYDVVISKGLNAAIQEHYSADEYLHIVELCARLSAVGSKELVEDLDLELYSHFYGERMILREQLGPLADRQIQLIAYRSESLREVMIVGGYRKWVHVSYENTLVFAGKFAAYERSKTDSSS